MTTVRRIVVSQIDGDTANNTNINEIRPFGETAFYLDQNFETQKLTLMMFDGQRTHIKSKVLAPGVLWGSSADSGDGNNYDTIKLIPDAELFANGSNQYLIVDPTAGEPGHIHLRAGGTQDASGADLYLGGERTFVRVSDTYDNVAIGTTGTNANFWVFGSDGILTFPDGTTNSGANVYVPYATSSSYKITTEVDMGLSYLPQTFEVIGDRIKLPNGNGLIQSGDLVDAWSLDSSNKSFTFPNQSDIEYGDGTYLSTGSLRVRVDFGGEFSIFLGEPNKTWTFGNDGNLTLPGGGGIDGSDYDVEIIAGNDGSSTFGSVTINTQAPPTVYTVTQEGGSPGGPGGATISGSAANSPAFALITVGMTVTGPNLAGVTTVTDVTGPDEFGTYTITTDADEFLPFEYNAVYTFTSAGGVTNRNWEFNSLGEIYLPRGGVIQETDVTNEAFGTTTTSLTLVPGGAANGTQRLEIYATLGGEGNHIHITSGDQNQTDLYLGNDTQYFAVGAMGQVEVRARPGLDSPTTGTSAYAGSPVWIYAGDAGDNGGNTIDGAPGGDVLISAGAASAGVGGDVLLYSGNGPTGYGSIKLSTNGYGNYLEFNKNDQLTFPSGGGIIFDSSATSTITGISSVIFADSTEQTTAWVAGGSSSLATTFISVNDFPNASFINSSSVSLNYSAYSGGPSFNFTIDCQSPLTENIGIDVGAVKTPYILSTGTVELKTNLGASTSTWIFDTIGGLQFPDNTVQSTAFKIGTVPVTSTSTGEVNTIAFNENYLYVCTATNSWQRIGWDVTPW